MLVPGTVTMFGELHGTAQTPAFVGSMLCNAARRRVPAILALELPYEATPALTGARVLQKASCGGWTSAVETAIGGR